MTLDRLRLLHARWIRRHPLRAAVATMGIAAAVALVVAMASLMTSATATANATVALLGGAGYEITVAAGAADEIAGAIEDVERVDAVRRYIEVPVIVDGTQAWLVALEQRDGELASPEAQALAATDGLRAGAALPSTGVHLFVGPTGEPHKADLAGRADPLIRDRFGGRVVVADLTTASSIRGSVGIETLLIYGDPAPNALSAVIGVAEVRDTEDRIVQARNSMDILWDSLSILAAMGVIVGGFLLFNTMNMTVLDRRHEIASLRALGAGRRSVLAGVLAEAALLGAVGSALGLVLGNALAGGVIASVPDAYSRSIGTPLRTSVPAVLLVSAWLLGTATAMASAIIPARRAVRIEPLAALRPDTPNPEDHEVSSRLWLIGLGVALTSLPGGQFAIAAAMVGLLCIAAGAGPAITAATVAVAKRLGSSGELAATSLRRSPRRVWGTTTVVLIAVATAVFTSALSLNIVDTTSSNLATVEETDFWIGTTTGDTIAITGLPTEWTAQFEAIPGVRSVAGTTWVPAESGSHIVGIQGVRGDSAYPFSRLAPDAARADMTGGDGAIILNQTARTFGLQVGDLVDVPGATPALRLPVVAITNAIASTSGGMINISHDLFADHYGVASVARYEVQLEPDADRGAVRRQLDEITAVAGPSIQIHTGEEFLGQLSEATDQVVALINVIMLVIVTCAGVGLLNTLLASTLERTSEIGVLRAIGATRRRIVMSVAAEALAIGLTGAALGAVAGSIYHAIIVDSVRSMTAFPIDYAFSPTAVAGALFVGIAIAGIGALVPSRRASRLDILDALSR